MLSNLFFLLICFQASGEHDVGPFARALWFLQEFGESNCSSPQRDRDVKNAIAKAISNDREISQDELGSLMPPKSFKKFSGKDNRISDVEITKALSDSIPKSRLLINPELRKHAELLTTSFDMIESDHHQAIETLASWMVENWDPNSSLHVIVTCTGNSRRSILGSSMGNLAASYYGLENVVFHSGGTVPSAFNKRTIAALKDIGFEISPTGEEAERGVANAPNPIHRVIAGKGLEAVEFSKSFKDKSNPQSGFAAILVCSEADAECPVVPGAALRLAMTFIDPKIYDDGSLEKSKYAERRDDIGRTFLAVMAKVRRCIQVKKDSTK